jgi:hypothetical protein
VVPKRKVWGTILLNHLRHVVNRNEITSLALLQIAVPIAPSIRTPALLSWIGHLNRYPLFDARHIERSTL